jgi:hypothetical protein
MSPNDVAKAAALLQKKNRLVEIANTGQLYIRYGTGGNWTQDVPANAIREVVLGEIRSINNQLHSLGVEFND